jgi:aminoglycoside N3'-acetyltransferase
MTNKEIITQPFIEAGLKALGVTKNMQLEIHSSLSRFGHVDGGAETIISALMNTVTEYGSIVMPSFLLSPRLPLTESDRKLGVKVKLKILSLDSDERSGMGIIADTFRKRPDVLTGEGIFRVSAWGREKAINSKGFSNLMENDGLALLLGVDIYRLSSMHYVESLLPEEVKAVFRPSEEVQEIYPPNQWLVETGEPPVKAWYKIQEEAYRRGSIKDGMIGRCKCMLFKINDVVGLYKHALETDPLGLYGL